MSDIFDGYQALSIENQVNGKTRRELAEREFEAAVALGEQHGLFLKKCTTAHYQLSNGWIINLYPGNGRVYADPNHQQAPFLKLPEPWTLTDAVKAAIKCL